MPADVTITTDPVLVYGMVGLLIGAVVLALFLARPRRGLGAATESDAARLAPGDGPWMPGGDIYGQDQPASAAPQELPTIPALQGADHGFTSPSLAPHDPWSTGSTEQTGQQPRWDKP